MNNLSYFLSENVIPAETSKYVASKRIVDENGNPVEWELRAISSAEDDEIRTNCVKQVVVGRGRRKRQVPELDTSKYLDELAVRCTVYPNLKDVELQNSYGVMGEIELLKALLSLPGEFSDYCAEAQSVCGFDVTFEEMVDEAKD